MKLRYILFFLIFISISLNSCFGLKIKGTKGAKKYYEEFFIDQGVLQYYIKPIKFKGDKEEFLIDFTFRDTVDYQTLIAANYSFYSDEKIKNIDSTLLIIDDLTIKMKDCERLFIQKNKNYHFRNSCKITFEELTQVLNENLVVKLYISGNEHVFYSTKDSRNALNICQTRIIEIIELNRD